MGLTGSEVFHGLFDRFDTIPECDMQRIIL